MRQWQDPVEDAAPRWWEMRREQGAQPRAAAPQEAPPGGRAPIQTYDGAYPPPPEHYEQPPAAPLAPAGSAARYTDSPAALSVAMPRARVRRGRSLGALLSLGSALLSLALYSALFGWRFALGLVLLLLLHEMGHYVVIRAKRLPASLPIMIPFLGAFVQMWRMPANVRDEAEIALAGPLAGALSGVVCLVLAWRLPAWPAHLFLLLAYIGFAFNLLNLIPVLPLDGGRIVGAITRWLWPVGFVLVVAGFLWTRSPLLLLLGGLWIAQMLTRFRLDDAARAYFRVGLGVRLYIGALYFGLAAGLAMGMLLAQRLMWPVVLLH
jgi:Zn-dependent protease